VDAEPGYRRSASWYSRDLSSQEINKSGKTVLYFEGANFETQLYVNDRFVGEHIGGYIGFRFDITEFVRANGNNKITVRVSNAYNRNLIPSQKSDFFLFGGITRDVWVEHKPDTHINRVAISTPKVSNDKAETQVTTYIHSAIRGRATLEFSLKNPEYKQVINFSKNIRLAKGKNEITVSLPELAQPNLWSPDTPHLYTLTTQLNIDSYTLHSSNERFGYRWFEMKAPQDPEVYRTANEIGLLIWDELPWCRGGKGGEEWEKNTEHSLQAMIKQNYNHPSIIFWSLGNEMYWEEDFEGGGADELISPYLEKLNDMTKELDPYRLTTIRKYYPGWDIVDAFSPSIWAGWYGGSYNQYEAALKKAMSDYPAFLHMEYGGSSHVGRHTETPVSAAGLSGAQVSVEEAVNQAVVSSVAKDTDWNESYIVDLFDWHLNVSENLAGFAGNAQWAFKDFGTPLRPENPLPYMNQKGLVDRDGNKKDAYYVFASYWSKTPFCWIESDTWTHRNGPKEGRDVTVYCNTEQAELSINGESLGKKTKQAGVLPAGGLVWQVPFNEGMNKLSVSGYIDDKEVATDSRDITYLVGTHGKYDHIKLTAKAIGNDRYLIEAEARDENGNRVLFEAGNKPSTIEFRTQNIKGVYVEVPAKSTMASIAQ